MIIVGFELVAALVARERKLRPQLGKTLDRRAAAWKAEMGRAQWTKPTEVKAVFGTADVIGGNRVVFDLCGNNYRIVVLFSYVVGVARIRFAGSYAEYDKIDATKV